MPLPRFNSGRMGTLEWSHLNEAFDLLEKPEATQPRAGNPYRVGTVFLARILTVAGTGPTALSSFEEVSLSTVASGSFEAVAGGLKSTDGLILYTNPIVGSASSVGAVVAVLGHYAKDGTLYFRECGGAAVSASANVFMARIVSSQTRIAGRMWTYTVSRDAELNTGTNVWSGGTQVLAFNGCENVTDSGSIGVGSVPPPNVTSTRNPIKNDTVVSCITVNAKNYFSIPNGYTFVCN